MKFSELLSPLNITPAADAEITGIANNSGEVLPGFLFIAIKGYRFDGADFIPEAVKNGAAAILADRSASALANKFPNTAFAFADMDMRLAESRLAATFYPDAPAFVCAVTGTNGKSSVVNFARQLWEFEGTNAASIGTVGIKSKVLSGGKSLTTPDALDLHRNLEDLARLGVSRVALETSSHGIEQHRADSLKIMAAGFTNLSNDHLDFYKDVDEYFKAKLRLFKELLDPSGTAVVNIEDPRADQVIEVCRARNIKVIAFGEHDNADIKLVSYEIKGYKQQVKLSVFGKIFETELNLVTKFQISNLMCAIGLFVAGGGSIEKAAPRLPELENEKGRIEYVATAPSGARIYVDFGHNGDGIKKLLTEFRPYVKHTLTCIAGSSGERPEIRRIEIGQVLNALADKVIIVDDNPRAEDPAKIRATLLKYCPKAREIPDRERAIEEAIDTSRGWDSIIICGTMYEKDKEFIRQKLAPRTVPLDRLLNESGLTSAPSADARTIANVSMNSQGIMPPAVFVGIQGFTKNGSDFAAEAIGNGAAALVVPTDYEFDAPTAKLIEAKKIPVARAKSTRKAFADLAYNFYGRSQPDTVCAVTGTSGKSSTVDFLRQMWALLKLPALSAGTIGVIVDNVYSEEKIVKYAEDHTSPVGDEIYKNLAYFKGKGVEHGALEMSSHGIDQLRAENIRIRAAGFTNLGTDHVDFYGSPEKYLQSKSRLFTECVDDGGAAVLNADIPEYEFLRQVCEKRGLRVIAYGRAPTADLKIISQEISLDGQRAEVELFGKRHTLELKILGRFQLMNLLCAIGLLAATTPDWEQVLPRLGLLKNALGRLEYMGRTKSGASIYVDFSYKGDALESTLKNLRSMSTGRLVLVFSTCGDVYETRRRKELGEAARDFADVAILTDDSPRTEDPQKIRDEILAHCPGALEVKTGRRDAIAKAIKLAQANDIILVAGKGHEDYITIGEENIPYTDQDTIRELLLRP
ncbi:MAG: UDP-N-acetylmuramoyl-L-alanyl-D-glutamate--2,6-diaminopimelate ligase [Rickettsiales bacterium]|jgi:UDP-N-acetylmuramoyl-L-alanyl-D-glutamate--2,6-diaminopimelate ligase|nr:UDP-N-acetylmuramoyl-L-alanyl-D-glutamate--2,6-diaminopimelate ligase [Rickettsiales bacterium]